MNGKNGSTHMKVSLPVSQRDYVRAQALANGCRTPSEYLRRLIRADQQARGASELEARILAGLDSPARAMTGERWSRLRRKLRRKLAKPRKAS